MKKREKRWSIVFALAAAFLGFVPSLVKAQIVQIDGSSTVFPVTEAVAEEFQKAKKGKVKGDRRDRRHRRGIQEVLPRRNRYQQCLPAHS